MFLPVTLLPGKQFMAKAFYVNEGKRIVDLTAVLPLTCPTGFSFSAVGSLPGFVVATAVGNAIKNRASNEEILTVLKDMPNPNQDEDDGIYSIFPHEHFSSLDV